LWQFKNTSWEQDDNLQSFRLSSMSGKETSVEPIVPLVLLIEAKKHRVVSEELCAKSFFPNEFEYCPFCGKSLVSRDEQSPLLWLPPYGNGSGFKILANELVTSALVSQSGQSFHIPSINGRYSFAVLRFGAKQRLLIAIQRDTGKLSVHQSTVSNGWIDFVGAVGEDNLPEWSWAAATDSMESGLALPSVDGPVWVTGNFLSRKLNIQRGEGSSVGGIVKIGNFIFAPVRRGQNFFLLARKDGDERWSTCASLQDSAEPIKQLCRTDDQLPYMGIPVVDDVRTIVYWPCRGGYVKVKLNELEEADAQQWEFKPWETDEFPATALIELGPPYRKMGARAGFWQLCVDKDLTKRDQVVNKIIKFDGDERLDSEISEYGEFVSTGRSSFSWLYDFWSDVHQLNSNQGEKVELRFPLLQFANSGVSLIAKVRPWQGREDVGLFTDVLSSREKASVYVRFVIEGLTSPEQALYADGVEGGSNASGSLFKISLAHLNELSVFVFERSLHIYFPEQSKCYRWPIEMVEA
jgi:hypothetical protein